jgi:hypothetical protein
MTAAQLRRSAIIFLSIVGLLLVLGSLLAESLGLGSTPSFGALQMMALLGGATILTLAFYLYLDSLRPDGTPRSLQADVGVRLSATGLVLAYTAGFADLFSIGTHIQPEFVRPYVGPLQVAGLVLGFMAVVAGMILFHTSRGLRPTSSLDFVLTKDKK